MTAHASEALALLKRASLTNGDIEAGYEGEVAAAQVHATLAVAAALDDLRRELHHHLALTTTTRVRG